MKAVTSTLAYYDRNTRGFLKPWRGSAETGAIHRPLWAPGVRTRTEAMHYIDEVIANILLNAGVAERETRRKDTEAPRPLVVDLGSGVGASLAYIHRLIRAELAGVTLSEVQAEIARERLPAEIRVETGDFMQSEALDRLCGSGNGAGRSGPPRLLDGAWMIESFVHAPDAAALLGSIARHMRPGGVLVICDDMRSDHIPAGTGRAGTGRSERRIAEFTNGWHVLSFLSPSELERLAAAAGFRLLEQQDLSRYVRNGLVRGLPVHLTAALGRLLGATSPGWSNFRGGSALQHLGRTGIVEYQLLSFRRD